MIVDLPKLDDAPVKTLITGELAFSDSPAYMRERRAKALLAMPEDLREAWLFDAEREEGVDVVAALRSLMREIEAIES